LEQKGDKVYLFFLQFCDCGSKELHADHLDSGRYNHTETWKKAAYVQTGTPVL